MGYTHYWDFKEPSAMTKEVANQIACDVSSVIHKHKNILQFDLIPGAFYFNGKGDDGHETFAITSDLGNSFNFCKTARKPYDIVVCKVLLIFKHHLGDGISVSSDGFSTYQPDNKKYKEGDKVRLKDLDGTWGKAVREINKQLKTNFHFIVNNVYGKDGCYFSYTLKNNNL